MASIICLSLNSFASEPFFYDGTPFSAKQARGLVIQSIAYINFHKIEDSAKTGACTTLGYELTEYKQVAKQLNKLGYKVTGDRISWCD